jgi:hypothetical protein
MGPNTAIMVTARFGLAGLGACATTGTRDHASAATCRAAAAARLVGHAAPDDATILRRTGGTMVRRLAPGDMRTQDYLEECVTVTIAAGRVIAASCG